MSVHEITATDEDLASESIISGNKYNILLQRVNPKILLFNDEGDPKVDWSKQYECKAPTVNTFKNGLTIGNDNNDFNNITFRYYATTNSKYKIYGK